MAETTKPDSVEDMPDNPVGMAALVFLHREVTKGSQVVLTSADFEAFEDSRDRGFGVVLSTNEAEDIVVTAVKPRSDA